MVLGKKFLIFPVLLVLLLTLFIVKGQNLQRARSDFKQKAYVGKNLVWVKTAQTPQERERGLSGVKQMGQDEGMLFIFSQKQQPAFWMKDMNFPLDFVWIADDKVVDIHQNIPIPSSGTLDNQVATVRPKTPVDMVLEVNADWIEKLGIKIGDSFTIQN